MFSDRLWLVKAAVALGLLSGLCTLVHRDFSVRYLPVERVALFQDSLRGRAFHLTAQKVVAADPEGFGIESKVGRIRFLTSAPPPIGEFVTINARAVGPRTLAIDDVVVLSGYRWKRPLNYGISILTLIVYLWLIRKRFAWRIHEGVLRSKT